MFENAVLLAILMRVHFKTMHVYLNITNEITDNVRHAKNISLRSEAFNQPTAGNDSADFARNKLVH